DDNHQNQILVIVIALGAPLFAPHDPELQSLRLRTRPPVWGGERAEPGYWLGTDALGRDILSRVIFGARISMIVGIGVVTIQGIIGVLIGLAAGYFGGWVDSILMRLADVQQAVPFLILAVAVAAVLDASLWNVILVLAVAGWVPYGRVVRGQVLSVREREFVEATRALGSSHLRIIFRHILPNILAPITVIGTLTISTMILAEASLSFLGLGVPPPTPTWGGMIADGRDYLASAWWVSVMPGIAIFATVLSINLLGDRLRELTDPTLRHNA
ncbi:MAG: ABC transporter permease, partial [Chloroflexota bacterium]